MNNKLLIVGTMAYDAIETPFGKVDKILGGAATYIGLSASQFSLDCAILNFKNTNLSALTNSKNQSNGNCIEKSEDVSLLKIIEIMGMTGFDCKMN